MEIRIKLNKSMVQKSRKVSPRELITEVMVYSYGTHGSGYLNRTGEYFIGVHYEKHNRKMVSSKKMTKIHNGENVMTTKRKYNPSYWKITYYKIPVEILKFAGLKFEQGTRNFKFIKK